MIKFEFVLMNSWITEKFKNIYMKWGSFSKYKHWELQLTKYTPEFLGFRLDTRWRGHDHAGILVELILLSYNFRANIYDSRHWDYINNSWMQPIEEENT